MKILIVHLSDIHAKEGKNLVLNRKERIFKTFQNLALDSDIVFVVITGDIAYSGGENEYSVATDLLNTIKRNIEVYSHKDVKFIMVPGNHDCYYEIRQKKVREAVIKDIEENRDQSIDDGVIEQCCEVQDNYVRFMECYQDEGNTLYSDKLIKIVKYNFEKVDITFYCYNTSWMSRLHEEPGKMHFPIGRFPKDYRNLKSDLNISVLHHPFNWQNPSNAREFASHIENTSDIVLTGHGHVPSKSIKDDLEGKLTEYVEGSVLQGEVEGEKSGFNVILVDLENEKQKVYQYYWNGEYYSLIKEPVEWLSYKGPKRISKRIFEINDRFEKEKLDDPGAQFRHPRKAELKLDDVFVFPHLRDLKAVEDKSKHVLKDIRDSEILLGIRKDENKILLIGAEKSGKSALCKMLFKHYYKNGFIPVYVNGEELKSTSMEKFNKFVNQCFREQYSAVKAEEFDQLDNGKKLLIIDDFDKLRLNLKYRSVLLGRINEHYPNVIITGNDLFQIGEMVSEEKQKVSAIESYKQYAILQFGNVLRSRLINKWNILGREEYIEEDELIRKIDEAKKLIDSIIGKNLVPSYPIFLLTLLQAMEIGYPHNLEESSYGHYYQFLISEAISKVVDSNAKIDAYYNYLTELANYLFENNEREISIEELNKFHKWHCDEYRIGYSFVELLNLSILMKNLIKVRIIEENNGIYRFKYKYVYYFFAAKYLANNISRDDIKERISAMCERLYLEDFSNTIMFLTHHSKEPFILAKVISSSERLFSKAEPVKLDKDIEAVNNLLKEVPRLVLESRDVRKSREKRDRVKDDIELPAREKEEEGAEINLDVNQEIVKLNLVSEINTAFKTTEILGQILKNYHSSLKGPVKFSLSEEAYLLGLRSLDPFFKFLEKHSDYVVRRIGQFIDKKKLVDEKRIEEASRRLLFGLCGLVSFGFIKNISDSVGSEHLSETFKEILEKYDINSVHLVDVSIKLDFYRAFPFEEIKSLKKRCERNNLALTLLREMVIEYLYMFPTTTQEKQRICSILEIPMESQRAIDIISVEKKI